MREARENALVKRLDHRYSIERPQTLRFALMSTSRTPWKGWESDTFLSSKHHRFPAVCMAPRDSVVLLVLWLTPCPASLLHLSTRLSLALTALVSDDFRWHHIRKRRPFRKARSFSFPCAIADATRHFVVERTLHQPTRITSATAIFGMDHGSGLQRTPGLLEIPQRTYSRERRGIFYSACSTTPILTAVSKLGTRFMMTAP